MSFTAPDSMNRHDDVSLNVTVACAAVARAACLDPLVAGMRRTRERCAARVVVSQDGGDQVRLGRTHAVEMREVAVAVPEEAQHRHLSLIHI